MSKNNQKKDETRPPYTPPQAIRLDDVQSGVGGCGAGNSPSGGIYCVPNGNGASIQTCQRGNGAKLTCGQGNGVKP